MEPTGEPSETTAVVVLPGLRAQNRGWERFARSLRGVGFRHVGPIGDANPASFVDVPRLADELASHLEALRTYCGVRRTHLVGHNLGGLVARYYVQVLDGDDVVDTVVTVGTPHFGTVTPLPGDGVSSALHPDSWLLGRLAATMRDLPVRWLNYLSGRDLLVQPAGSAVLPPDRFDAANVVVENQGDLSLVVSPAVRHSVVRRLLVADRFPTASATDLASRRADDPLLDAPSSMIAAVRAHHPSVYPSTRRTGARA